MAADDLALSVQVPGELYVQATLEGGQDAITHEHAVGLIEAPECMPVTVGCPVCACTGERSGATRHLP